MKPEFNRLKEERYGSKGQEEMTRRDFIKKLVLVQPCRGSLHCTRCQAAKAAPKDFILIGAPKPKRVRRGFR